MKTHKLKLTQPYFDHVRLGIKTFELRRNDGDFQVGDILELIQYDLAKKREHPCVITARIVYMLENYYGIEEGYAILGIEVLEK